MRTLLQSVGHAPGRLQPLPGLCIASGRTGHRHVTHTENRVMLAKLSVTSAEWIGKCVA